LQSFLLELCSSQEDTIQFKLNGNLVVDHQPTTVLLRLTLDELETMELPSDELEATDLWTAEVFSVVLPVQKSKVCVSLPL